MKCKVSKLPMSGQRESVTAQADSRALSTTLTALASRLSQMSCSRCALNRCVLVILCCIWLWTAPARGEFNPPEPPMSWDPAFAENYCVLSSPAAGETVCEHCSSRTVDRIVIHTTQCSLQEAVGFFKRRHDQPGEVPSASHFVVGASGEIVHMVEEEDVAYHAPPWNCRSFGIEHEGETWVSNWPTYSEYAASARLTRYLCWYYGIARDRSAIIGHTEVPDTNTTLHPDPGTYWDWTYYMALVQDDDPPQLEIDSVVTNESSATVSWTGVDYWYAEAGIDHYECWIDSGAPVVTSANQATFDGLCEGTHVAYVRAFDRVLNATLADRPFAVSGLSPTITMQPSDQTVASGGTATFSITASGVSPLSYQWQKNQTNLTNSGHYSGCTTATLAVSSCDSSDQTAYRCVVTNSYGSATSNQATLTLSGLLPTITMQPSNQTVASGGAATFSVTAVGLAPLSYRWQKSQVDLNNGGHYSGCSTTMLIVSNCDSSDQAAYRCVVTNSYGSATSDSASLDLDSSAPKITQQPTDQAVTSGSSTHFNVVASGTGLGYRWQRNGMNLDIGGHYSGVTTEQLTVYPCDANDAGGYRCVVSNYYGSDTSNEATLTILYSLNVYKSPGGAGSVSINPQKTGYAASETVTLTAYANAPYAFSKWTDAISGNTVSLDNPVTLQMDNDRSVTAVFVRTQALLSTTADGAGTVAPAGLTWQPIGSVVTVTASPLDGWCFAGWEGALSGLQNPGIIIMHDTRLVTAVFRNSYTTWVDFAWSGPEYGLEAYPFNTLFEGVRNVCPDGTVKIKTGSTSETIRITKPVRLEAVSGVVRIGQQ